MKLNLYKIEQGKKAKSNDIPTKLKMKLKENEYKAIEKITLNTSTFTLYLNQNAGIIKWIYDLKPIFSKLNKYNHNRFNYNAILFIQHKTQLYALSFGHSFFLVQGFCDYNFALDFAEKELSYDSIDTKTSDFIQNIKIRELLNVKKESLALSEGGESYKFVSGTPSSSIFGNRVDCGFSIAFNRDIDMKQVNDLNEIISIIDEVESVLIRKQKKSNFPRVRYLNKEDALVDILDKMLLDVIFNKTDDFELYSSRFDIFGSQLLMLDSIYSYQLHIRNKKKSTLRSYSSIDKQNIIDYFAHYASEIVNVDDVVLTLIKNGIELPKTNIKSFMFSIINLNRKTYLLSSNRWGEVNKPFLDNVKRSLEVITNEHLIQNSQIFNIKYSNEDNYIDQICKSRRFLKLHKRLITIGSSQVEVADLYDRTISELLTVKLGTSIPAFVYSFDQATTAIQGLINYEESELENKLKGKKITQNDIDGILTFKSYAVVLGLETRTYAGKIKKGTLNLNDLRSTLLKLKIISWCNYMKNIDKDYKIYVIAK